MKYQEFTPSGCTGIGVIKFEFVAKTQVLWFSYTLTQICEKVSKMIKHENCLIKEENHEIICIKNSTKFMNYALVEF